MTTYYRLGDTISEARYIKGEYLDRWTPVVVIDPEDREEVERLARELMETTDRLQAALREFAKPTLDAPTKPEEPTGLGALVRDDEGDLWQRDGGRDDYPWARITQNVGGTKSWYDKWEYIVAVEVIFEGVTA